MTTVSKDWIQGAVKRPGALTKKANKAGMGVQAFAREHAHDKGLTGQQARLAQTFSKLRKAASGAVIEVESADTHKQEVDEGKEPPIQVGTDEPNMVLVGDGGSDPAAEEYLFIPAGSEAVVAPKMSPDEKPSMENAERAVANIQLKKAANGANPAASYMDKEYGAGNWEQSPGGSSNAFRLKQSGAGNGSGVYDHGVGIEPTLTSSAGMGSTIDNTNPNSVVSDQFGRGARNILLNSARGMVKGMIQRRQLHRAAAGYSQSPVLDPGGRVVGYQSVPIQQPSAPMTTPSYGSSSTASNKITPYQQAQLDLQKQQLGLQERQLGMQNQLSPNTTYATDAQKWIAQQNIQAQAAQNAASLQYQRERLALDKLLGERQAATDEGRLKNEAMQNLMTRAGRQLVAPGGNVIPSMQPLIGRSIN